MKRTRFLPVLVILLATMLIFVFFKTRRLPAVFDSKLKNDGRQSVKEDTESLDKNYVSSVDEDSRRQEITRKIRVRGSIVDGSGRKVEISMLVCVRVEKKGEKDLFSFRSSDDNGAFTFELNYPARSSDEHVLHIGLADAYNKQMDLFYPPQLFRLSSPEENIEVVLRPYQNASITINVQPVEGTAIISLISNKLVNLNEFQDDFSYQGAGYIDYFGYTNYFKRFEVTIGGSLTFTVPAQIEFELLGVQDGYKDVRIVINPLMRNENKFIQIDFEAGKETLDGICVDQETGAPIADDTIYILALQEGMSMSMHATEQNGRFQLSGIVDRPLKKITFTSEKSRYYKKTLANVPIGKELFVSLQRMPYGVIKNEYGTAVTDAIVVIDYGNYSIAVASDQDGHFPLGDINEEAAPTVTILKKATFMVSGYQSLTIEDLDVANYKNRLLLVTIRK